MNGSKLDEHACPGTGKVARGAHRPEQRGRVLGVATKLSFALGGLLALIWFLVRVVPKPSRAAYPCQRVAFPMASSFVLWLAGALGSAIAFRHARRHLVGARYAVAFLCVAAGVVAACWTLSVPLGPVPAAWEPQDPPNQPIGVAKGIHPGRVVWAHDPDATSWNGSSNYWWSSQNTDQAVVDAMMSRSLRSLAGETTDAAAWDAIFHHFNRTHGRGDVGYTPGEGIAVKINMNVAGDYALTNEPIASPQMVRTLLHQLIREAVVTESAISVYDASRCITDAIYDPCHAEFPQVQFVDGGGGTGRVRAVPADDVPIYYADSRVGSSGTSRLPKCAVDSKYLINMALLRGHSLAGVTLGGKNHFGSVWRPGGGFSPSNIHTSVDRGNSMGSRNALVDLLGHEQLGGKTLLFVNDALYAAVNQGSAAPTRWDSSPFLKDWTSSLFLSQDGVALDSVAVDFCRNEPKLSGTVTGPGVDNYLHEAALADDPPSGATYDPEGDGTGLASLGVHEHWNNATEKKYSRNLGTGEGIELVLVPAEVTFRRGDVNVDGGVDISDAVVILFHLFVGGGAPACARSADADDSGELDVTDVLYLLGYLFLSQSPPPEPFGACGVDPTEDALDCLAFPACGS
jgi:uncharacterized protein (DUF362 family)